MIEVSWRKRRQGDMGDMVLVHQQVQDLGGVVV